jgi:hypothetical protein
MDVLVLTDDADHRRISDGRHGDSFLGERGVEEPTRLGRFRRVFCVLTAVLPLAATACRDCVGVSHGIFNLSVHSVSGENLAFTTFLVVRRLAGTPPVPVDSVQGLLRNIGSGYTDTPGTYRITVSHEGYVSQDRTVTVLPHSYPGECGSLSVVTQDISFILVPSES